MRRLFVSGIIVLSLLLLTSTLPSQTYAVTQNQKCFKLLRYTFCITLPPKTLPLPTMPPIPPIRIRPTVTPTVSPTPTPAITPTPTPTNTPTPTLTPTSTPTPPQGVIVFVNNQSTPFNWSAPQSIPPGYKSMTWTVSSSNYLVNWAPQVSFDGGTTFYEQHRFKCNGPTCAVVTIPILGDTYRFSLGTSNGIINASAVLNEEPGAQVLVLGQNIAYQFTSPAFFTGGGSSSITITAGGGDNPQHLIGISLQRGEGGSWSEKGRLNCYEECPLQSLPLIVSTPFNEVYHVVMEGSGTGGVLGAIIRP